MSKPWKQMFDLQKYPRWDSENTSDMPFSRKEQALAGVDNVR